MKTLTCGTFITDGKHVLLGHSSGNPFWDIPKGKIEEGETPIEAAIRECKEEFNYDLDPSNMVDIGKFSYNKKKNIHLFVYVVDEFPDLKDLKCTSFCNVGETPKLEIDGYRLIKVDDTRHHMCDSLRNTVIRENIFQRINDLVEDKS